MGNKKAAATHGLSKKERKALEAREAELSAKLTKAERKAKTKGKGKTAKPAKVKADKHPALEHLDRIAELQAIKADKTASKKARREAEIELEQYRTEGAARIAAKDAAKGAPVDKTTTPLDAETAKIKARVAAKVQARNLGIDIDAVDLHDAAAVTKTNKALAKAGVDLVLEVRDIKAARMPDAEPGESEVDYQQRKLKGKAAKATEAKLAKAVEAVAEAVDAVEAQVAEQVETEGGREVGDADEPAAPPIALTDDGKRYLITRPDGTEARYTRATTYIDGLEHTGGLEAWKLRTLLEGIAVNNEATAGERDAATYLMGKVSDAIHQRDLAIAKLDKADRKGKLDVGERGLVEVKIMQAFKAVVDDVADEALDLGGAHVKANKGTDLHALTEVADREGIEHIRMLAEAGTITPADLADIEAYVAAMARAGLKVVETEAVVVHDELGVAGTLDRVVQAPGKLLGRARGAKVVADIKTGNMEYSIGKTAMQVTLYATAEGYEHGKPERRALGVLKPTTAKHPGKAPLKKDRPLKRDGVEAMAVYEARVEAYDAALASYNAKRGLGLLIHLPQGQAQCTIHLIDLNVGAAGLKVVKAVRAWRNDGKRGIDLKADLVAAETAEGGES